MSFFWLNLGGLMNKTLLRQESKTKQLFKKFPNTKILQSLYPERSYIINFGPNSQCCMKHKG